MSHLLSPLPFLASVVLSSVLYSGAISPSKDNPQITSPLPSSNESGFQNVSISSSNTVPPKGVDITEHLDIPEKPLNDVSRANETGGETLLRQASAHSGGISATIYQSMLFTGIETDWFSTSRGFQSISSALQRGDNLPSLIKEKGFSHILINLEQGLIRGNSLGKKKNEALLSVLEQCKEARLAVVLGLNLGDIDFSSPSLENSKVRRLIDFWGTVASMLKKQPSSVSYRIVLQSEVHSRKEMDEVNRAFFNIVKSIHSHDPSRVIIASQNGSTGYFTLSGLDIQNSNNLVIAEWQMYIGSVRRKSRGLIKEKNFIRSRISEVQSWTNKNSTPTYLSSWRNSRRMTDKKSLMGGSIPFSLYSPKEQAELTSFLVQGLQATSVPFSISSLKKFFNPNTFSWRKQTLPQLNLFLGKKNK